MKCSGSSGARKLNCCQIFHESEDHEIQQDGETSQSSQKTAKALPMSDDDDDLDKDTLGRRVNMAFRNLLIKEDTESCELQQMGIMKDYKIFTNCRP